MDKNSWLILFLKQFRIFWIIIFLIIFKIIPFYYSIIAYIFFCMYHYLTSTTELFYSKNSFLDEIIQKSNLKLYKYKPSFFFPITPLQFLNLSRTKEKINHNILVKRQNIGNNGVCIDWIKYEGINNEKNPILIIFPGLTGSVDDPYVINIANECIVKGGFNTCIYQMRILSENLKVNKKYLFLVDDIDETLDEIRKEFGENKIIYAIGISYGANQMVKYLGQKNYIKKKIYAAVSISNPYEFIISARLAFNKLYNRMLLMFLQKVVAKSKKNFEKYNINADFILNTNQIKDFDDYVTANIFGFMGADDYYRNVSCVHEMKNINIPLLCISSKDDQICFKEAIPYDDIKLNKNIDLLLTSHGSHICFIENDGIFGVKQWILRPILSFLMTIDTK